MHLSTCAVCVSWFIFFIGPKIHVLLVSIRPYKAASQKFVLDSEKYFCSF